jgi:hypothetical protein
MLGFNGFERDFVALVAALVNKDARTLAAMRRVSRTWRAGCEQQWGTVRAKCFFPFPTALVSIFETDAVVLKKAIVCAFWKQPALIIDILRTRFSLPSGPAVELVEVTATHFIVISDGLVYLDIYIEICDDGYILCDLRGTGGDSGYVRMFMTAKGFVREYKEQFVPSLEPKIKKIKI